MQEDVSSILFSHRERGVVGWKPFGFRQRCNFPSEQRSRAFCGRGVGNDVFCTLRSGCPAGGQEAGWYHGIQLRPFRGRTFLHRPFRSVNGKADRKENCCERRNQSRCIRGEAKLSEATNEEGTAKSEDRLCRQAGFADPSDEGDAEAGRRTSPEMGKLLNQAKKADHGLIDEAAGVKTEGIGVSRTLTVCSGIMPSSGVHPITQMCYDLNGAFRSMGFEIFEGGTRLPVSCTLLT